MSLTQEILKELLIYNPDTGIFTRKTSPARRVKVGDTAGSIDGRGYLNIVIEYKKYKAHRLAWLYMYGSLPQSRLDHKNRIKIDNRINNLREATNSENCRNVTRVSGASGYPGVTKHGNKWRVQCNIDCKKYDLGSHLSPELAHKVYEEFIKQNG